MRNQAIINRRFGCPHYRSGMGQAIPPDPYGPTIGTEFYDAASSGVQNLWNDVTGAWDSVQRYGAFPFYQAIQNNPNQNPALSTSAPVGIVADTAVGAANVVSDAANAVSSAVQDAWNAATGAAKGAGNEILFIVAVIGIFAVFVEGEK